ncbi:MULTISPECIES: hypothetical protein [unclassified Empedobacter]|uniref:hypothetical protein n=1 Tax=unclassified Empedobacter TaxID=2643773 RepID=UPI00244B3ECD|nr:MULTISPECIES: hypothetical protein [unclassified Empedobacter]MDH0658411.1 hypothetical protein [Empedobacter sp. GD03865]MDH1602001.1 hypothetical protein [Empedobacter sp. GD03739]
MKFLKYFFLTLFSAFIALVLVDVYYSNQLKKMALFSGEVQEWNQIREGKTNVELAIFGSSRAFIQINPNILEQDLKLTTHNFGLNGSKFKMQLYRFNLYLNHNPKPKIVVWNLDTFSFSHIDEVFQPNQYAPFMLWNFKLYEALKEYKDTKLVDFIVPLYRYRDQTYWKDQIARAKKEKLHKDGLFRDDGFKSYNRKWNVDWGKMKKKNSDFDFSDYALLEELIAKCEQENIQLIFTIAPEFYKGQDYMLNREEVINRYQTTLQKHHLPLLDYSTDSISFDQKYFYNTTHMNYEGADAFTKELAKDLKKYIK